MTNKLLQSFQAHRGTLCVKDAGLTDDILLQFFESVRRFANEDQLATSPLFVPQHWNVVSKSKGQQNTRRDKRQNVFNLRCWNTSRNKLSDIGATALAAFIIATPTIRICNLSHNCIGSEGVNALVLCVSRSNLTALVLQGNPGWDQAAMKVRQTLDMDLKRNRKRLQAKKDSAQLATHNNHRVRNSSETMKQSVQNVRSKATTTDGKTPRCNWKVAIVGGGIAGCAAARALQLIGLECVVFEKDAALDSRHQGYGLTIQQATQAVRRLNISQQILDESVWSSRHFIFDNSGKVVAFWGPTFIEEQRDRKRLTQRLLRKKKSATYPEKKTRYDVSKCTHQSSTPLVLNATKSKNVSSETLAVSSSHEQQQYKVQWKHVGGHNLHIPRQSLRRVLFESLKTGTVRWGYDLKALKREDETSQICLEFKNGSTFLADIVIGADGIFSSVRRSLYANKTSPGKTPLTANANDSPSGQSMTATQLNLHLGKRELMGSFESLNYLGLIVILGIFCNRDHRVLHQRAIQMSDGKTRIFIMPFSPTESMWQLTFRCSDEDSARKMTGSQEGLQKLALNLCEGWAEPLPSILRSTPLSLISGYPVYDRDPMTAQDSIARLLAWPRVTMVGDAAHCMSPLKGQGANQALLDAVSVADHLWNAFQSISNNSTLLQRSAEMRSRTSAAAAAALNAVTPHFRRDTHFQYKSNDQLSSCSRSKTADVPRTCTISETCESADRCTKGSNYADIDRAIERPHVKVACESHANDLKKRTFGHRFTTAIIHQVFLQFERSMIERTTSKVLSSRKTVDLLHCPEFVTPEYQAKRKSIGGVKQLKRVRNLRQQGIDIRQGACGVELKNLEEDEDQGLDITRLDYEAFFR